jgi:hypothetical protein
VARDELAAQVKDFADQAMKALQARDDAQRKLAAFTAGAAPVSAAVGEVNNGTKVDPWKRAQQRG